MATKKKTTPKSGAKKMFVLPDGARYEITAENGKYVFCGDTQFRRARGEIVNLPHVSEEEEQKPEKEQ